MRSFIKFLLYFIQFVIGVLICKNFGLGWMITYYIGCVCTGIAYAIAFTEGKKQN